MLTLKSMGSRTDPCGTPVVMTLLSETSFLTLTQTFGPAGRTSVKHVLRHMCHSGAGVAAVKRGQGCQMQQIGPVVVTAVQ